MKCPVRHVWITISCIYFVSFSINLKSQEYGGDIYFHMIIRFPESVVIRNALLNGQWGAEERQQPEFPFPPGQQFNIIILPEQGSFKVY